MSAVNDAFSALKNVVLMQERLDVVRRELGELRATVGTLNDRVIGLDRRLVRIETMIEMTRGSGSSVPRIEG
ncbi:hypothetical protein F1C10_12260 [Sphingomonas sp. NBWT7]|uniref:hypothetical protein n=1 Tax=Sphingomonas sp. NBWT7 TaxID=2596913 RepID=UPI0016245B27|nr:hypothetical protein [Sphingomonas sp. NBWT7]QNE32636.1 hypothetical protein F1C10_12260 [Sphingomonas sp. NBWT7]